MKFDFVSARTAYIAKRQKELDAVAAMEAPAFKTVRIHCASLSNAAIVKIIEEVRSKELGVLKKGSNILYYFSIVRGGENLLEKVTELKANNKAFALPKIGKVSDSSILYVGKTSNNFESRLRQHLDGAESRTYALHLGAWAPDLGLELDLHFAKIPNLQDHGELLEVLESVYHYGLKPLLGRSGH